MHDVLIIGAGPAGCIAAIVLARAGWRVTLIEQHRFPRDKVCGECLSSTAIDVLAGLSLRERIVHLRPTVFTSTSLYDTRGHGRVVPLPREMWGLSRLALDQALLDAARDAGAHVLQPARCERLIPGTPPAAVVRELQTNRIVEHRPGVVLLADGKGALLPRRPTGTGDMGVKAHFVGVDGPRDSIELFGLDGHYVGLAAIEDARWNLAMSVPAKRIAQCCGDLDALQERTLGENPVLRDRLRAARRVGPWLSSPLPRFSVARRWPAGIIPLGNAAAAIEPIGGEGMGLAMRSGEMAAEMLLSDPSAAALHSAAAWEPLHAEFERLWRVRGAVCRATAVALSHPVLGRVTLRGSLPPVTTLAMRCMGK